MDERTGEIVGQIFEERQRLGSNITELEQKFKEATNWRSYFVRKPWAMLGGALAAGFLLSGVVSLFMPGRR
jgi:ElaB/YqjD/DUF883 family membrane-anchored ribosome-binding protein